jgi:hypothetical protein
MVFCVLYVLGSFRSQAVIGHCARQMFARHAGRGLAVNYSCDISVHVY